MADWEVVVKKKKEAQLSKRAIRQEEQEILNSAPKLEELLPQSEVRSLYSDLLNVKSSNAMKNGANPNEKEKKVEKRKPEKKKKTNTSNTNDKPRTLEAAIANMKFEELKSNYEISKARFDDNPLLQLKSFTAYLVTKLVVDQNKTLFTSKCFDHPFSLFPEKHRQIIQNAFVDVKPMIRKQFYETCLETLANNMNHGEPVSGYKVVLQALISNYPPLVFSNVDKTFGLLNSYTNLNKVAISTALLWVIGQAGSYSFQYGLEVWKVFMIPLIEQRNYTRFAIDYLKHLFARYSKSNSYISLTQYFEYIDLLFKVYNIPKAFQTELQSYCKLFREKTTIEDVEENFLYVYEKRVQLPYPGIHRQEMLSLLYSLLKENPKACIQDWKSEYLNLLPESVLLLRLIYKDWDKMQRNGDSLHKNIKSLLQYFKSVNVKLLKNKDGREGLEECNRMVETLLYKMTTRSSSTFRWIFLVLLMGISMFVAYDISLHGGNFSKSNTGKAFKDAGFLKMYEDGMIKMKYHYSNGSRWFSRNGPTFLKQAIDYIVPYIVLMKNLLIIFSNAVVNAVIRGGKYVIVKLPLLHEAIESYCPGITDLTKNFFSNTWQAFFFYGEYLLLQSIVIFKLVLANIVDLTTQFVEYLQKNVFVGEYSPENLQKMTFQGLGVLQEYISSSVTWISHKINDLTQAQK